MSSFDRVKNMLAVFDVFDALMRDLMAEVENQLAETDGQASKGPEQPAAAEARTERLRGASKRLH